MGEIIHLQPRLKEPPDNLITSKPLEFRKADWETAQFIQMSKFNSAKLECHREEVYKKGESGIWQLPSHFSLSGGMGNTIRAMYVYREDEERMREIYYLIGLMDCMTNQVNPILRTDLLRAMYKKVFTMRKELNIHWHGPLGQILLPIDSQLYNESEYKSSLTRARTMKELYRTIRKGTDEMFDIFSLEYVFYCPAASFQHL